MPFFTRPNDFHNRPWTHRVGYRDSSSGTPALSYHPVYIGYCRGQCYCTSLYCPDYTGYCRDQYSSPYSPVYTGDCLVQCTLLYCPVYIGYCRVSVPHLTVQITEGTYCPDYTGCGGQYSSPYCSVYRYCGGQSNSP